MQALYRYEEIARDLREQIRQGKIAHGERLPAERLLTEGYNVQRNTIRQALTLLQKEGWLDIRPRSGAFALRAPDGPTVAGSGHIFPTAAATDAGTVLVINAWNRASTALDRILVGLGEAMENSPYTIQRFNSQPRPNTRFHVLPSAEYLDANPVAGAILWAQNPTDLGALIELRNRVPLILVDRRVIGFETDCIRFDDKAGGYHITRHLIEQGHRRIGFLGDETFAETVQQRWHGYALALEEAQVAPDPSPFALFEGIKEPMFSEYMRVFLAGSGEPLTAVVCSNDMTALILLRFLRREGYRVPDDVAVTGYGNLLANYRDSWELTTINQPFEEAGRQAGALLRQRMKNGVPNPSQGFCHIELPVELIVRATSSVPSADEPETEQLVLPVPALAAV